MTMIFVYLLFLFIAPQLWIPPFIGMAPDLAIYGLWMAVITIKGKLPAFFAFEKQDWFFFGMLIWMSLTMFVNYAPFNASDILKYYIKAFIMYRLVVVSLPDLDSVRRTQWLLLFFALILSWEGIDHMNSATGHGWAGQDFSWVDESAKSVGIDRRTRWINIFDGPGVFAVIYTIAIPFAIRYIVPPYSGMKRIGGILLMIPMLFGLYYTGSRGGYLTVIAICGLFVLARMNLNTRALIFVSILGGVFFLVGPSYLTSTTDSSGSAQHRVDMWAEGIDMVTDNPIFGIGKGNYLSYTQRLIAHNSSIEIMGETGFVGLFLWLSIIVLGIKNLVAAHEHTQSTANKSFVVALGISICGYMVSSMFVTLDYETFYFLLALTAAVGKSLPQPVPFTLKDVRGICIGMVGFYIGLKLFIMSYY